MRTSSPSGAAVRPLQTPPISFCSSFVEAEEAQEAEEAEEAADAEEAEEAQEASVAARTLERAARPELSAVLKRGAGLPQL